MGSFNSLTQDFLCANVSFYGQVLFPQHGVLMLMLACYKLKQRRVIFTVVIQATGQMKAIYASGDRWYSINVGRTVAYCLQGLRFDPRPLQVMNQSVLEQDTECQLAPNAAPVVSGPWCLRMVTADVQAVLSRVVATTGV